MSKYRISAVAQLTGLSPALIRAWEARYALVNPHRTAAGYRLYSDDEVALLLGAQRLVQQGIAPMQVARLSKRELREQGGAATSPKLTEAAASLVPQDHRALIEQVLAAFSEFDGHRAEQLLGRLLVLLPPTAACEEFIVPLLREIGERWHRGQMTVAAEHFGTNLIRLKLQGLLETFRGRAGARRVLCACPPDELHEAGLLMFALGAAVQGWEPIYLGASLPLADLTATARIAAPDLVALSLTMRMEPKELRRLLQDAQEAVGASPMVVGGPGILGFEDLVRRARCLLMPSSGLFDELLAGVGKPSQRGTTSRRSD